MLGQFAATAASGFLTAKHLSEIFLVANGRELSPFELFLAYSGALLFPSVPHHFFLMTQGEVSAPLLREKSDAWCFYSSVRPSGKTGA